MFTHILFFLRFLIRIYFLSVLAKRETIQLILEHPAAFPVHGQPGSGLISLRKVLDRIFFFLRGFFILSGHGASLALRCQCDSMCLEGSTPGAPATRFSHKSTFNAVLANTEKNQSYNHRCLEWTRERQLNQCLTHKGREKIKIPSMQGRRNWQGTENMEELCTIFFFKYTPVAEGIYKF